MQLTRTQAVELLLETGAEAAEKWTNERLKRNINRMKELDDEDDALTAETEAGQALLESVLASLANGETIDVCDDPENAAAEAAAAPLNKKQHREAKKAAAKATAAPTKKTAKAADKPAKAAKAADKPAKAAKGKNGAPSNKEVVYKAWSKSKDQSTKAAEKLHEPVSAEVKLTTVRSWISSWNRGENLPACAKTSA